MFMCYVLFFFSSRRRHTRCLSDWSSDVCSSDLENEFVIDFAYLQPANPIAKVRSRIISSPRHTKRLLAALQKNLARYEERYGVIELSGEEEPDRKSVV